MSTSSGAESDEVFRVAHTNRLLAVDMFERLTPEQWATPSLCEGWTVREVAGHLLSPLETRFSWPRMIGIVVRYRGDLGRYVDVEARKRSARPTEQIVADLRSLAGTRLAPPVVGPGGPLTDSFVHLRDAARPLGLDDGPEPGAWRLALDFLVSPLATRGFLPKGRFDGVRLVARDADWSWGEGQEVRGDAEAVAMAAAGRPAALPDLDGPGVAVLAGRLAG